MSYIKIAAGLEKYEFECKLYVRSRVTLIIFYKQNVNCSV
jgi:hypothetical protein